MKIVLLALFKHMIIQQSFSFYVGEFWIQFTRAISLTQKNAFYIRLTDLLYNSTSIAYVQLDASALENHPRIWKEIGCKIWT